jgi:hypothetical protein
MGYSPTILTTRFYAINTVKSEEKNLLAGLSPEDQRGRMSRRSREDRLIRLAHSNGRGRSTLIYIGVGCEICPLKFSKWRSWGIRKKLEVSSHVSVFRHSPPLTLRRQAAPLLPQSPACSVTVPLHYRAPKRADTCRESAAAMG